MLGQIAFRNTIKNWRHSISALLSLSASFVSLVLFDGYLDNVKDLYAGTFAQREMLGHAIIENRNLYSKEGLAEPWNFWIKKAEQQVIQDFLSQDANQVETFVRSLVFQGMMTNGKQSQIFLSRGFDIDNGLKVRGEKWAWNAKMGKPLHLADSRFVGLLGGGMARKMGCTWEQPPDSQMNYDGYVAAERPFNCTSKSVQLSATTVDGQVNALDIDIVGLMDAGYKDIDDRYLQTTLETAQTLLNTDSVTYMSVELKPGMKVEKFIENFYSKFGSTHPHLRALNWVDHRQGEMYKKTMDFLAIFRNFVIVVILVVSTLSVLNTMVKIVKERTREIGTLRSFGFQARQIVMMFFYESLYLSGLGIGLGIIFSLVITFLLNSIRLMYKAGLLSESIAFRIHYYFPAYFTAMMILVIVSVFACYFATKQILKSKIVDNLNHV